MINKIKKYLFKILGICILTPIIALAGSWGGQRDKWTRRFLLPGIVMIYAFIIVKSFWVFTIFFMSFALSIGYGLYNPLDLKVSTLGLIAYKLFPNDKLKQNMVVRGLVGLFISLSLIVIPILQHTWLSYIMSSIVIIGTWATISWRNFGTIPFTLFKITVNLLKVDIVVYAITGVMIVTTIHGLFLIW